MYETPFSRRYILLRDLVLIYDPYSIRPRRRVSGSTRGSGVGRDRRSVDTVESKDRVTVKVY